MSINVTVHGNPISIKRGKMVALDKDNNEFEVRRKIRIQQVRQQSKKIAEDVRNKVRKEKDKQLGKFNCDADATHAEKQNLNLNCLNRNLRCSLDDFGQAYRDAENHPDENELLKSINQTNTRIAELRGQNAQQLLQDQKNYEEHITNKHNKDIKYARYIEDLRAKLVSDLPKHKKRKRKSTNIEINDENIDEDASGDCLCESLSDSDLVFSDISINLTDPTKSDMATLTSKKSSGGNEVKKSSGGIEDKKSSGSKKNSGEKRSKGSTNKKNNSETNAPCREIWDEIHSNKSSVIKSSSEIRRCLAGKSSLNSLSPEISNQSLKNPDPKKSKLSWDSTSSNKENISKKTYNTYMSHENLEEQVDDEDNEDDDIDDHNQRKNWYEKFMKHKETDQEDDFIGPPCRPVLQSHRPPTVEKNKHRTFSPDRPLAVKKTLRSNKDTKVKKKDLEPENLEKVSPVKVLHKIKKKKVKVKSSLHDTNYIKPTLVPCEVDSEHGLNVCPRLRELPKIPTTYVTEDIPDLQEANVKCYDRFNKFAKEESRPLYIQKINEEDINVIDDPCTEEPCTRKIQKAKARGARAMEKVKIEKDYQRLLKELPILEKQERLANMKCHKPSLHMTDDRLKEYERKKQNAMECKFENMQSRAEQFQRPVITLKSIRKSPPKTCIKMPLEPLDISISDVFSKNTINSKGTDSKETNSCEVNGTSSTESTSSDTCPTKCDEEQITNLLKRVNKQRELLLKEALYMKLGNLKDILNEDELINLICKCQPTKVLKETATSPSQPTCIKVASKSTQPCSQTKVKDAATSLSQRSCSQNSSKTKRCPSSNSDSSFESRPKMRPKVKKFKIYLKEEGTQTSPCVSKCLTKKGSKTSVRSKRSKRSTTSIPVQVPSCPCVKQSSSSSAKGEIYKHSPCLKESSSSSTKKESTSTKESTTSSDKVCEIIIRADKEVNIRPIVAEKATQDGMEKDVIIKIKEAGVLPCLKNLLNLSTSTSYFSPPCEIKSNKDKRSQESCRSTNKDLLQPQKQQTNFDGLVRVENGAKQINPRLIKYITRLLNMSRQSIEELTVSSVSDVSTPHESIVQTSSNMAKEKLHTVMEHFRLSADDIKNFCMSSTNSTLSDENTGPNKQFVCVATSTDRLDKDESVQVNLKDSTPCNRSESPKFRVYRNKSPSKRHESPKRCFTESPKSKGDKESSKCRGRLGSPKRSGSPKGRSDTTRGRLESPKGKSNSPREESRSPKESPDKQESSSGMKDTSSGYPQVSYSICGTSDSKPTGVGTPLKQPCIKFCIPKTDTSTDQHHSTDSTCQTAQSKTDVPNAVTSITTSSSDENLLKNPQNFLNFVRESLGMSVLEFSELGFEEMFSRHMELTEYCHDRIKSLMTLIEQIRKEKREICSSPIDHSITLTSYLDLPDSKKICHSPEESIDKELSDHIQSCLEQDVSSENSLSQDAIDRYLLGINGGRRDSNGAGPSTEPSFPDRLKSGEEQPDLSKPFIPMLEGIPKYSGPSQIPSFLADLLKEIKPKPPPSLLRSNLRGHTNEIPHELSTIAEMDTLISSRNTTLRPKSPEEKIPSRDISPRIKKEKKSPGKKGSPDPKQDKKSPKKAEEKLDISATKKREKSRKEELLDIIKSSRLSGGQDKGGPMQTRDDTFKPEGLESPKKAASKKESEKSRKEELLNIDKSSRLGGGEDKGGPIQTRKNTFKPEGSNSSNVSDGYVTIPLDKTLESSGKIDEIILKRGLIDSSDSCSKSGLSGFVTLSDTSQETPDELEALLRKFKLEWAISLVKKTEQAMALSSSSSSSDMTKKDVSVDMKDKFKNLCKKLASLNESDVDKVQLVSDLSQFKDFHDISEISGINSLKSKSHQRTSTPVQHSKSTESNLNKKSITNESFFKIDSELSSVKNSSDENNKSSNLFLSIPNITLNTEHISLRKS